MTLIDLGSTVRPLNLETDPNKHVQLDIVALERGGFTICVDKIPHAFAKDVEELDRTIKQVIAHVFQNYRKEADGTTVPQQ